MTKTLPYIDAYGNVSICLNKIIEAQTPTIFSQDFLSLVLEMTGGGARPVIKYMKNMGFLSDSGAPTDIYRNFRINSIRGRAAAEALRIGYADLFKRNEYIHDENDKKITEAIVSTLQCDTSDLRIKKILKCFNNVKIFADFEQLIDVATTYTKTQPMQQIANQNQSENLNETFQSQNVGLNLAYTVNLNLPESTNPEVFNAIFKSLKENLLKND